MQSSDHQAVLNTIQQLYELVILYNGFGEMRTEIRILKKGQKEVIIHCGKQYRFVVDYVNQPGGPVANTV